jgi:hypothetical protein
MKVYKLDLLTYSSSSIQIVNTKLIESRMISYSTSKERKKIGKKIGHGTINGCLNGIGKNILLFIVLSRLKLPSINKFKLFIQIF